MPSWINGSVPEKAVLTAKAGRRQMTALRDFAAIRPRPMSGGNLRIAAAGRVGESRGVYGERKANMTTFDTMLNAALRLSAQERLRLAYALTRDYDGQTVEALAEAWAEDNLGMIKAGRGEAGIDGKLPNGRALQIKSKKAGAHKDSKTYVKLSASTRAKADDLLIVFVDYTTCKVTRAIGPVAISSLPERNGRYFVHDILRELGSEG